MAARHDQGESAESAAGVGRGCCYRPAQHEPSPRWPSESTTRVQYLHCGQQYHDDIAQTLSLITSHNVQDVTFPNFISAVVVVVVVESIRLVFYI